VTDVDTTVSKRGMSRTGRIVIAVLSLAVAYLLVSQVSTQRDAIVASEQADAAQQDAKSVADPLVEVCQRDEEIRSRLGDLCDTAAEVKDQAAQPADGQNGADGAPGRGIAGTAIVGGRLLITYTDGVVEDKGPVVGGEGQPGLAGRSIVSTTIQDGALILSYSDGTTETAGQVVGADGRPGRGISSVTISADFRLLVTYTDGETVDVGPLPSGRDGRGVASVSFDMSSCTATVTYTDGTTESAPMTGCTDGDTGPTTTSSSVAPLLPLPGG
jgi:hypothetical protein